MEKQEITYFVFYIIVIFLMLLIFIMSIVINYYRRNKKYKESIIDIEYKRDQAILQTRIEVQEATLSTLGKELHDNIGQLLSSAKMLLGITERNITYPPDTLITASETVGQAINELRSLSKSLSKEWLEQFDLIKNLEAEVERVNSAKTMKISLEHVGKLAIKADEQIILFRIVQEAMQNSIKHANAQNIFIRIETTGPVLLVSIKDDGNGFNQSEKADGVGLINMKHRSKLLGATIEWSSSNQGSAVLINLPLKAEDQ